jgi:hypothetical protein
MIRTRLPEKSETNRLQPIIPSLTKNRTAPATVRVLRPALQPGLPRVSTMGSLPREPDL